MYLFIYMPDLGKLLLVIHAVVLTWPPIVVEGLVIFPVYL